jgi:hypothetical protein
MVAPMNSKDYSSSELLQARMWRISLSIFRRTLMVFGMHGTFYDNKISKFFFLTYLPLFNTVINFGKNKPCNGENLFTVFPSKLGIGDMTCRLITSCALGSRLGLSYLHSRWVPDAIHADSSEALEDVLGWEIGEEMLTSSKIKGRKVKIVDLSKYVYFSDKFAAIKNDLCNVQEETLFVFFAPPLRLNPFRDLLDSVDNHTVFAEKYGKKTGACPPKIPFSKSKINIFVHLRRGDRCLLGFRDSIIRTEKLCEKIFDKNSPSDMEEYRQLSDNLNSLSVSDVASVLSQIYDIVPRDQVVVAVYSDGYSSSSKIGMKWATMLKNKYDLSESQLVAELRNIEEQEFAVLGSDNLFLFIGESNELLKSAIHSIVQADVLLTGIGYFKYAGLLSRDNDDYLELDLSKQKHLLEEDIKRIGHLKMRKCI